MDDAFPILDSADAFERQQAVIVEQYRAQVRDALRTLVPSDRVDDATARVMQLAVRMAGDMEAVASRLRLEEARRRREAQGERPG